MDPCRCGRGSPAFSIGSKASRASARDRARADELATQEALRDSEERLRLVRRATGLGMYEIDWVARRRYWSPELRALLRVPDDLDINTDADLLERIIPEEMRAAFRDKMRASLDPGRQRRLRGRAPHHALRRLDRLAAVARQDLLRRRAGRAPRDALDRPCRRHLGPQARRGGERAARLDRAVVERRDLLDRSRPHHPHLESGRRAALRLHRLGGDRPPDLDSRPGSPARRAALALHATRRAASRWCSKPCAATRAGG